VKANWLSVVSREKQLKGRISKDLQFRFENSLDRERSEFASKWKTFFERAGGRGGLAGYITVIQHYSTVVFFHLELTVLLVLLYFGYDSINNIATNASSVSWILNSKNPVVSS
jgi:hypothetical protein